MTCNEFEQLVVEVTDEDAFEEASARHVADCPRCADRLAAEARVTQALRALADADAHREAPAHVETMARTIWRGMADVRASAPAVARSTLRTVRSTATTATARDHNWRRRTWWGMAAAAAGFTVIVAGFRAVTLSEGRRHEPRALSQVADRPAQAKAPTQMADASAQLDTVAGSVDGAASASASTFAVGAVAVANQSATQDHVTNATLRRRGESPSARSGSSSVGSRSIATGDRHRTARSSTRTTAQEEIDVFVSFPYAEPLRPTEVRQIVRVALPQATLMLAGLRTQAGTDPVVADLLIGEDGIARGIRVLP